MDFKEIAALQRRITDAVGQVICGKDKEIRLIVTALLCGGHVLLDDVPGTGKTTLAKALARAVSADCTRVQFTPDLLPSDLSGIHFYNQKQNDFVFRPGPILTNILIADEINRTTPRTQSAMLECMQEHQVTIDGETYPLPAPFFVIATQNPIESQGTFPLPEAQLDRFLIRLSLGYPDAHDESELLRRHGDSALERVKPVCTCADIVAAKKALEGVTVSDALRNYIIAIAASTRKNDRIRLGVSPRGSLALLDFARAWAVCEGRDYLLPDDVKAVAVPVLSHRILVRSQNTLRSAESGETMISYLLDSIPVPIG